MSRRILAACAVRTLALLLLRADDPRVQRFLAYFQGPARGRVAEYLARSARYEPMIRQRFAVKSLPGMYVRIPS
jgi:hypothetical protein